MKYILSIVLILIIGTVVFILKPEKTFETGTSEMTPAVVQQPTPEEVITDESKPEESPVDERRAAMQAEYDKLVKARKDLEKRLSRLKAVLWDVELPKEQGEKITEQMKNGYALLKNPKMLGAFSGVAEISDELSRVEFAHDSLEGVEESVPAMKNQ